MEPLKEPVEQPQEIVKKSVIIGIDPAFKKCGFGVICSQTGCYIESFAQALKPDKKMIQSECDGYMTKNASRIIKELCDKYDVKAFVIELQLGQFSAVQVQVAFISAISDDIPFNIQHSKLKLKHVYIKDVKCDNPDSKQYNQNKHIGRGLANLLFPDCADKLTFDECDALLHAKYAFDNFSSVKWIKKIDLE